MLDDEIERRAQKQLALRVRREELNTTKTLEGFNRRLNPSINCQQDLACLCGQQVLQRPKAVLDQLRRR